jgi:flagellar assembly protein FliH
MRVMSWALDEFAMPDIFPVADEHEPEDIEQPHVHAAEERSRIEAEAHARGRAEGERAARAQLETGVGEAVDALREAVSMVQMHEARWVANAEENIAALAVAVARHIVQREVSSDPSTVRELVSRALVGFPLDAQIVVRLNPADIAACGTLVVPNSAGRTPDIRYTADPHIMRGGCLIEGRDRIIDGRIDTSLERAYRAIGNIQA